MEGPIGLRFKFTKPIGPKDWLRFEYYTKRVRSITFSTISFDTIHPEALDEFAALRPPHELFPRLRQFEIYGNSAQALKWTTLFMGQNVNCLVLDLDCFLHDTIKVWEEVPFRMPRLKELILYKEGTGSRVKDLVGKIVMMLSAMKNLQAVDFPLYACTSEIMTVLSTLPSLASIDGEWTGASSEIEDVIHFSPLLLEDAFASLSELTLSASVRNVARFLASDNNSCILRKLHVYSPQLETAESIAVFISFLPRLCEDLEDLQISATPTATQVGLRCETSGACLDILTGAALYPLRKLLKLRCLSLEYHRVVRITEDELADFVGNSPCLENLFLNTSPTMLYERPHLSLMALRRVAQRCPSIRSLGLYIDARNLCCIPDLLSEPTDNPIRFDRLEILELGLSPIEDKHAKPVARYISQLVPSYCEITSESTWSQLETKEDLDDYTMEQLDTRTTIWGEEVKDLVPLLVEAREQEREWAKKTRKDMEDLGYRHDILKEQYLNGIWPDRLSPKTCLLQ